MVTGFYFSKVSRVAQDGFASMDTIAACQSMICFSEFSLGENIDLKLEVAHSVSNSHLLRK